MKIVQILGLYVVPVLSAWILLGFVINPSPPDIAAAWGAEHGVNQAIAMNYPRLNMAPVASWIITILLLLLGNRLAACITAAFATGYVLCDIVFYLPMAKTAGEAVPYDQLAFFTLNSLYVAGLFLAVSRERKATPVISEGKTD